MSSILINKNSEYKILIDLSYFIFYRYYALIKWWKFSKPDDILGNPIENEIFVEKFKKTFINKINEIPKKLKINNYSITTAADCKRLEIWRNKIYDKYKENRVYDDDFLGGPFFELGKNIIKDLNIKLLYHAELEADDCIAIIAKNILSTSEDINIIIMANDMDYLQLACPRIQLINLKYKYLTDNKNWSGDPKKDLFCKIVMGDKSDNILSIFKKCGPKTAMKCYNDKTYFTDKLKTENAYELYEKNKKLIDFNEIPENLINEFMKVNL